MRLIIALISALALAATVSASVDARLFPRIIGASSTPPLAPPPPPVSHVYHVQKTGSDSNPGTLAAPFQHIWKGYSVAAPSDFVCIDDTATYDAVWESGQPNPGASAVVNPPSGGTAGYPITLSVVAADGCAGGNVVTINRFNGNSGVYYGILFDYGRSYMTIHGLSLKGQAGCTASCFKVYGASDTANAVLGGGYANNLAACVANPTATVCTGVGVGTYDHHTTLSGIEVYRNGQSGFEGHGPPTGGYDCLLFFGNLAHENSFYAPSGGSGISVGPKPSGHCDPFAWDNDTSGNLYGVIIADNDSWGNTELVTEQPAGYVADGNGIIIGGNDSYTGKVLITQNILHGNTGTGAHCFQQTDCTFTYNTAWHNELAPHGGGPLQNGCTTTPCATAELAVYNTPTAHFYNNITVPSDNTYELTIGASGGTSCTVACAGNWNDRFGGAGVTASLVGANDITTDPTLNSPSTGLGNWHLLGGSPAVGAAGGTTSILTKDWYNVTRLSPSSIGAAQ